MVYSTIFSIVPTYPLWHCIFSTFQALGPHRQQTETMEPTAWFHFNQLPSCWLYCIWISQKLLALRCSQLTLQQAFPLYLLAEGDTFAQKGVHAQSQLLEVNDLTVGLNNVEPYWLSFSPSHFFSTSSDFLYKSTWNPLGLTSSSLLSPLPTLFFR